MLLHELLKEAGKPGMNFQWDMGDDEKFRTFASMIKKNNGIYYSDKQRYFLQKKYNWNNPGLIGFRDDVQGMKDFFNIDLQPGEKALAATGMVSWAGYGARSQRPVTWYFVCDDNGVVAQYKLKYKGDMRKGTGPDPSKTQLIWKREDKPARAAIDALKQEKQDREDERKKELASLPPSKHVGRPGERIRDEMLEVEASWGPQSGAFGSYFINKMRDKDGNVLVNFGNRVGNRGDKIKASFRVKKHDIDPKTQQPVTIITHLKFQNIADLLRQ